MRFLTTALLLASTSFQALAVPTSKAGKAPKAPKAPKTTAANLVEQESAMPSPVKPLPTATADEMAARFFAEALQPYGEWLEIGQFGKCWRPAGVGDRWAPYTVGHWAYSKFGWTWVSEEDFGGIVFHYGRWVKIDRAGWCWVPDLEWAASWVSWRYGTDVLGWAPLPPKAKWNPESGIGVWVDSECGTGPDNYVFCQISDFSDPMLAEVLQPQSVNPGCFQVTIGITNISLNGKTIFCGGPAYNWAASRAKGKIPVIRITRERSLVRFREQLNDAAGTAASFKGVLQGDRLTTVSPEWGILADPRRADALGFTIEGGEDIKPVKWSEAGPAESNGVEEDKARPVDVPVFTGWEGLPEGLQRSLKLKLSKEVAGLTPATSPAARFDSERDLPTFR
jgi:hypothetical protein